MSILLSLQLGKYLSFYLSVTTVLEEALLSAGDGLFLFLCLSSFFTTVIHTRWLQSPYLKETVEIAGTWKQNISKQTLLPPSSSVPVPSGRPTLDGGWELTPISQ